MFSQRPDRSGPLARAKIALLGVSALAIACSECGGVIGLHDEACVLPGECDTLRPSEGQRFRISIGERYDEYSMAVPPPAMDWHPGKACPDALALTAGDHIDVRVEGFGPDNDQICGLTLLLVESLTLQGTAITGQPSQDLGRGSTSGSAFGVARVSLTDRCTGILGVSLEINPSAPEGRSPIVDRTFIADDGVLCGLQDLPDATCIDSYVHELTDLE
jgi:hypothetical protein